MVWLVPGAQTDRFRRDINHLVIFLEGVQLYNTRVTRRLAPHSALPLFTPIVHSLP